MKTEDVVKALRRLKVETGSLACMGCGYEHNCGVHGCRIMRESGEQIERLTDRCARYAEEIAVLQERTRWIPVTERLPEISNSWGVSDVVLCIISDPSGYPPPNPGLCVYLEDGRWTCHGQIVRVTHWMPLPDGPEVTGWSD